MKFNYFKKSNAMKNLIYSFAIIGMFGFMILGLSACKKDPPPDPDPPTTTAEWCHNRGQLYCDVNDGRCCDQNLPYNDGHGTCYGKLETCRKTGWACSKCW